MGKPLTRRTLLGSAAALAPTLAMTLAACAAAQRGAAKVLVVGGGFGGATAAKYLRLWSEGTIAVTLIEPKRQFVSCPMSNLVLGGSRTLAEITLDYDGLRRCGVEVVHERASAIAADRRHVKLASGARLAYDRLVVSPGIELLFDRIGGMTAQAAEQMPHAWQAGAQTSLLRRQLLAMRDGGTVLISVPLAPYRCPPGPYERACQIAWYLRQHKPKSKLIVLDANPQVLSKGALFSRVWAEDYAGIVEYRPNAAVVAVDPVARMVQLDFGERVRGDVVNLIPPMRAADIARGAGLVSGDDRWCEVNWATLESVRLPQVHVLGDATLAAPGMPKSGHMANQHGKAAAAAIVELFNGREPAAPVMTNTCYSFIDHRQAIHVASVHRWDAEKRTLVVAPGGGVSSSERARWAAEGAYAWAWAQTIWADTLGA